MASHLQILGVLLALVASGYSLSCTQCTSSSDSCTGPRVTCPSGSVCGAKYREIWARGSLVSKTYKMLCLEPDMCDMKGSMSLPHHSRVKLGISCCRTDQCTPTFPSMTSDSSVSNGVICRSCMTNKSNWCYTSDTMQCTGDENMCLLETTKISGPKEASLAVRGCATKTFCDLGSLSYSIQGESVDIKFVCTSGSVGLQKGFYLPAVICIFFLKLLI
ncbi:phospholipase A2 inhibitor and Ly6/PLAUR domain-containing protein-like [Aquarana catesbeiana]|uniref:phospholipase A2 inhibitor and Ly6/PLAUR domain-containing protein-like n=1 Tax=Aquarana catesbeiana TaxID=8400 RepID=UPI003CC9E8CB